MLSTSQEQSLNRLVSLGGGGGGSDCLGFLGSGLLRKRWHKFEFVSGSSRSNRTYIPGAGHLKKTRNSKLILTSSLSYDYLRPQTNHNHNESKRL